ncbi:MAG: hypothetical protein SVY53_02595 [Chloroflexota bacterium]|nr:hypothetical protein [Chloroflexota bacterium]
MKLVDKQRVFHAGIIPFGLFLIVMGWTGFFAITLLRGGESFSFLAMIGSACMGAGFLYFVALSASMSRARRIDSYEDINVQESINPVRDIMNPVSSVQQSQSLSIGSLVANLDESIRETRTVHEEVSPVAEEVSIPQAKKGTIVIEGSQLSRISTARGAEVHGDAIDKSLRNTNVMQEYTNSTVPQDALRRIKKGRVMIVGSQQSRASLSKNSVKPNTRLPQMTNIVHKETGSSGMVKAVKQPRRGTTMIEDTRRSKVSSGGGSKADVNAVIQIMRDMHVKSREIDPPVVQKAVNQIEREPGNLPSSRRAQPYPTRDKRNKDLLDLFLHGEKELGLEEQS